MSSTRTPRVFRHTLIINVCFIPIRMRITITSSEKETFVIKFLINSIYSVQKLVT